MRIRIGRRKSIFVKTGLHKGWFWMGRSYLQFNIIENQRSSVKLNRGIGQCLNKTRVIRKEEEGGSNDEGCCSKNGDNDKHSDFGGGKHDGC
jgi:hypothetical protein